MKTIKCKLLGGPENCEVEFKGETFEKVKQQSMKHGHEMFEKGDEAHIKAMEEMKGKMQDPEAMQNWMNEKKKEFDELPEDS
jgi:hypothetical protein